MVDKGIGDYFITDADDEPSGADELLGAPIVVPVIPPRVQRVEAEPASPAPAVTAAPAVRPAVEASVIEALTPGVAEPRPQVAARPATREEQLAEALDELMRNDGDIQAAALVSLDGFTMASALPAGMQADRVGAMSAAILGLGERAAAELGRGHLSQVFIEGESGYVLLIAAGNRAVLTAMAEPSAKLGLVLYDMKSTADRIGQILG